MKNIQSIVFTVIASAIVFFLFFLGLGFILAIVVAFAVFGIVIKLSAYLKGQRFAAQGQHSSTYRRSSQAAERSKGHTYEGECQHVDS